MFSKIKDLIDGSSLFDQEDGSVYVEFDVEFTPPSNEQLFFEEFLNEFSSIKIWERLG